MKIELNENIRRQGDVTLVRVDKRPRWAKPADRAPDGRVIAEYGESSGHAHAVYGKSVLGFRATDPANAALAGLDYLEIGGSRAEIKHELSDGRKAEHDTVALAPGHWERAVQVEYDPEEERRIVD